MNETNDERAWLVFGNARLQNLAYTDKPRKTYVADLISHASVKLQQNGCASLLPLKIAPARFDDSRYYHLHLTSDFRPAGKNGAFHFIEPRVNCSSGESEPANTRAEKLALAASAYLQSCRKWAKQADNIFADLTRKRMPRGFKLVEVAVCVNEDTEEKFSAELDTLEIDLQTSRARVGVYPGYGQSDRFEEEVELHRFRQKHLKRLKEAGGDIFLDLSAQHIFASTPLTPQDVLSAMTGYRQIEFAVDTGHDGYRSGTFFIYDGILFADHSPNPKMTFEDGKLII